MPAANAQAHDTSTFDSAVNLLRRGSWFTRVGFSDGSCVKRFFWLSDSLDEIRWGESPEDQRFFRVRLDEVVGMTFGQETTAFNRVKGATEDRLLPWECFSLIFVGRTLDLSSLRDDAEQWFLAVQSVVRRLGFMLIPRITRSEVLRRKVMMKIRYKASSLRRSLGDHFRITLNDCSAKLHSSIGPSTASLRSMHRNIQELKRSLIKIRQDFEQLDTEKMALVQEGVIEIFRELVSKGRQKNGNSAEEKRLLQALENERAQRRKLHDELMELKGNIRVYTRVRPLLASESSRMSQSTISGNSECLTVYNENDVRKRFFEFDYIFHPTVTQSDVFAQFQPFIQSFLDGYNVCMFAYGATNSGKTYTMEGTQSDRGVTIIALEYIFANCGKDKDITVSCVQIYNETIYDLLNDMQVLELRTTETDAFEPDQLTCVSVNSYPAALALMHAAALRRSTNSTRLNQSSSRSHLVVTVRMRGCKLNLVDLAGSENVNKSGATGPILQEAKYINKSLSALGDVIHALLEFKKDRKQHVPFRNSKLTMLLKDSLQGNSKTVMIVQVSPFSGDVVETLNSLQFASRVRSVEMGKARKSIIREVNSPVRE